ncbi:flavoprotein [archaeon]|nr:flavoprotein [archaeon]
MSYLIISCSLNPDSKSRILAKHLAKILDEKNVEHTLLDLKNMKLPFCDGDSVYGNSEVQKLREQVGNAKGIIIASPIYNFDVNAVAKNMIELTGKAWTEKVVGFLCAAGGKSSYMSVMSVANSLMLDFRCLIIPRFVYAVEDDFSSDNVTNDEVIERIEELVGKLVGLTSNPKK